MRRGDKLRFRGPAGAPFMVTVSEAWTPELIRTRIASGEWTELTDAKGDSESGTSPTVPGKSAAKPKWVDYLVHQFGVDRAKAEEMTRKELIELAENPPERESGETSPAAPGQTAQAVDPGRPSEDADKSAWVDYVFHRRLLAREDAVNYTKDDLIEIAK